MLYIHFTEEQKRQANAVDLPEFLRFKGEPLTRSGRELRLESNHSVTVRGNEWYDHAAEKGGGPVSFLKEFYGMNYQQVVQEKGLKACALIPVLKDWNEDLCANFQQTMEEQQYDTCGSTMICSF